MGYYKIKQDRGLGNVFISDNLLSAVRKAEIELLKIAGKHCHLNKVSSDRMRTNGIASLGISAIAILNHYMPNLPDFIRSEMDAFVEKLSTKFD